MWYLCLRIKRIENLETLTKLDVLDLHGNQVNAFPYIACHCDIYSILVTNVSVLGQVTIKIFNW